jgi:hypothetical protein
MMAKLGGFDELPSNAQNFLTNYRTRLETMNEADSTASLFARSTALITARWEAWAQRRNQRLGRQRPRAKSCGPRDRLGINPVNRLRAIRPSQRPENSWWHC